MFVILNVDNEFWTGQGWSAEYPDAKVYSHERKVLPDARELGKTVPVFIYLHYGADAESRPYRFPAASISGALTGKGYL